MKKLSIRSAEDFTANDQAQREGDEYKRLLKAVIKQALFDAMQTEVKYIAMDAIDFLMKPSRSDRILWGIDVDPEIFRERLISYANGRGKTGPDATDRRVLRNNIERSAA